VTLVGGLAWRAIHARHRWVVLVIAPAVVLVALLTGCAPGTPDEDSWRRDATRAVGDVASAVQTARLSLTTARADKVPHPYLQTVLVDAERISGMATEKLSSVQPPQVEVRRSAEVTDRLDQATGLLTDARIAVVAGHTDEYPDLIVRLGRTADELAGLDAALAHPPTEAR
jgi:hypothetical protein